jgi:hypothetical protein
MYLETESLVEDGQIVCLRKLRIQGTEAELRNFALAVLDALETGKKKFYADETRVIVKRLPE